MSESCGSNAFPNAEVEKQKTNNKRTVDVEDEVLSITQKPFKLIKMTERFNPHWPEAQQQNLDCTQDLYEQSLCLETQQLNLDLEPVQGTQLLCMQDLCEQLEEKDDPEPNMDFIKRHTKGVDLLDDENLVKKILAMARSNGVLFDQDHQGCSNFEARCLAEKLNKLEKIEVEPSQVPDTLNSLAFQFHEYCKKMSQGVHGLVFRFDDGTFYATHKTSSPSDTRVTNMMSSLAVMYKHVISHYHDLKRICESIHLRYLHQHSNSYSLNTSREI